MNRRDFLKYGLSLSVPTLLASYVVFFERYFFEVNTYKVPVTRLPKEFEGFRIAQLTDIHYGSLPHAVVDSVIQKTKTLKVDLIALTGDYIYSNLVEEIKPVWELLGQLEASEGVYSVLGNHDLYKDNEDSLEALERSKQNIRHKSKAITKKGKRIWIGGAGDLKTDELGIDKTFAGVDTQECKILLAHNPDTVKTNFLTRVDLVIAGHTHGGQIVIPFYGPLVLPKGSKKYDRGFFRTPKGNLFISKGIGTSTFPVRFNCPPEITILELTEDRLNPLTKAS